MPIRPEMRARYPSDWALRSRFVRFVRAGGRCEWCGAVHGQPHPVTGSLDESIAPEAVDVMLGAQRAMNEASAIYERHGRFGFTGTGIQAMADALDLYGQIVAMSTPRQILEAAQEARRRVESQLKELEK